MKNKTYFFFSLSIFLLLAACASLHENAEDHYNQGAFEQSMNLYANILEKDPDDKKAQVGLKRAQRGWISQSLLQVRRYRLGKNFEEANRLLRLVFQNEKKWNSFPRGAAVFTQKEEVDFARRRMIYNIYNRLNDQKPLAAYWYISHYEFLFQSKKHQKLAKKLFTQIKVTGQNDCHRRSQKIDSVNYYYSRFLTHYCNLWKMNLGQAKKISHAHFSKSYSSVEVYNETENFDDAFTIDLNKQIEDKFKNSPWYHPEGKKVFKLRLIGDYSYEHSKEPTTLVHSYSESVPYEVTQIRPKVKKKSKKSSFEHTLEALLLVGQVLTAVGGEPINRVRSYDNGDGTETHIETRYRDEPRTMTYHAVSHRENFSTQMALIGELNNKNVKIFRSNHHDYNTVSHPNSIKSVGLFPKKAHLIGSEVWIQNERQELAQNFEIQLLTEWKQTYCKNRDISNSYSSLAHEWVLRCFQGETQGVPENYKAWFKNQWGITYEQSKALSKAPHHFLSI